MNAFFFWLFSTGMIVCALAVILNRNAVASALCFTFAIVSMSGLFVMLSAFFLAAVQIIVTAGAVMVLFLFIIMLLDLTAMEHMPRQKVWMGFTLLLALGFVAVDAKVLSLTPFGNETMSSIEKNEQAASNPQLTRRGSTIAQNGSVAPTVSVAQTISQSEWDQLDDTHQIGKLLFNTDTSPNPLTGVDRTSYIAPFEITSLLILVATIGVIVLCKQDERPRPRSREEIAREAPPVDTNKETAVR